MLHLRPGLKHIGARRAPDTVLPPVQSTFVDKHVICTVHGWTGCTDAGTSGLLQVNSWRGTDNPRSAVQVNRQPESSCTVSSSGRGLSSMANLVFLQAVLAPLCACRMLSAPRPTPTDSVCWKSHAAQELAVLRCRSVSARQGGSSDARGKQLARFPAGACMRQ
jgi:hypothetical protein